MTTAQDILDIVQAGIEPGEPADTILAYLKARDGKTLTARDLPKLTAACGQEIRFRRIAGMVHLTWGDYKNEKSLLVAYTDKAPTIDAHTIEHRFNTCWFSARLERNAQRATVTPELAAKCADAIDRLKQAQADLEALFAYGEPLAVAQYEIKRARGLDK